MKTICTDRKCLLLFGEARIFLGNKASELGFEINDPLKAHSRKRLWTVQGDEYETARCFWESLIILVPFPLA